MERYTHFWNVYVLNGGERDGFHVSVWADTQGSAERRVRNMYPSATIVHAERAD